MLHAAAACTHAARSLPSVRRVARLCSAPRTRAAPHRTLAVRAMASPAYDPDNIFKKIIDGKIPSYKIFETEHALAFLDAFPMAKGHALLIPKATGYATIYDMPADVAANVLRELPRLAKAVKQATGCDGVNIVQNNEAPAGQVVMHAHFHVIPRTDGDGVVRLGAHGGSGKMIDPADAQAIGDAIRAAL